MNNTRHFSVLHIGKLFMGVFPFFPDNKSGIQVPDPGNPPWPAIRVLLCIATKLFCRCGVSDPWAVSFHFVQDATVQPEQGSPKPDHYIPAALFYWHNRGSRIHLSGQRSWFAMYDPWHISTRLSGYCLRKSLPVSAYHSFHNPTAP